MYVCVCEWEFGQWKRFRLFGVLGRRFIAFVGLAPGHFLPLRNKYSINSFSPPLPLSKVARGP